MAKQNFLEATSVTKNTKTSFFTVNMVRIACYRDLNIIIMDTVSPVWSDMHWREILCRNRQGVRLQCKTH